ncbi:Alpha/beta hydrolase [Handroanthus impetiginosus]|uniref:Alpha/beta hydrolase n=1 Tax=Handroanthus impetiginosus TaxID=429701 RepID=A0A2G9IB21_9LAMI|nr:Alpha/beta hydrolase [Handroanthus impetiginosus]
MDIENPIDSAAVASPYETLLRAALMIPLSHYLLGLSLILIVFLYNFLEIHFLKDLFTGFRGQQVVLTFNPSSEVYREVVSKCRILHGSPHLQTAFLQFFGNPPRIFMTSDGGTIALDWVKNAEVEKPAFHVDDERQQDDKNPIIIIIPGLTSDSNSFYIRHLAFNMAKCGWKVVVSNHRGLGGVSITSDCLYNAGWTEDVRKVIDHLHCQYQEAPLFVVGTSIGANILICDRFMNRRLIQRFYNKALTIGLKDYAYSSYINDACTVIANLIMKICRLNTNVVLATTQHGGHLPFFEGLTAKSVWWVRAVDEFFGALRSSSLSHRKIEIPVSSVNPLESSIDQSPYMHVSEDGIVTAVSQEAAEMGTEHQENKVQNNTKETIPAEESIEKQNTKMGLTPERDISDIVAPVKRCLNQLSRQNRKSLWLLAYIAIITTWPVVGSALAVFLRKRFGGLFSRSSLRR